MPNHKGGVLVKDKCIQPPNPKCNVCSSKGEIVFVTDMHNFTVRQLEELVLKKKLNMVAPDVTMLDRVIISSDETDGVDMYDMTLSEAGMTNGCSFDAEDDHQNFRVKIIAYDKEKSGEEDLDFEILNNINDLRTANEQNNKTKPDENDEDDDDDDEDDCVIEQAASPAGSTVCDNNGGAVNHVMVDEEEIGHDEVTEEIGNEEEDTEKISNEEVDAEEISNEEKLAIKRKADEAIEDINDAKKSRVD